MYNGPGDASSIGGGFATGGSGGIIGAIIGTGAQLYDSYQNRKTSKENTDKTIAAQKAEAELAYQRSMQMWNLQNEYNSPAAQMARFGAAGLNPHLIYGQGSAGNASSMPQYQPPNLQYRYEAPTYGAALQSILPTLMAVGSWMQQMRKSQVEIERGSTETERARQLIDYLALRNPQVLSDAENRLSLFPYQSQMLAHSAERARMGLWETGQEFRHKFGEDLWRDAGGVGSTTPIGGIRRLQFLEEHSKQKLLDAKASWSEFDVTDPQAIMMLVLNGVMGLAGQTLRLSTHRRPRTTNEVEERLRNGRIKTRRTIRE